MKFITGDDLINRVELIIPSFFENNIIDKSVLYNELAKTVGLLGDRMYPTKTTVLEIKNKQACLPDDFIKEYIVYSCETYKVKMNPDYGVLTYEQRVCEIPACSSSCQYGHDENGVYEIIQRRKEEFYSHKQLKCLQKDEGTVGCKSCPLTLKENGYNIKDNIISVNFEKGSLFLEYKSNSNELVVPDYSEIIDWLEAHLIAFIFKKVWYNMEDTAYQRMQMAIQEAEFKKTTARAFWRRRDVKDFKDLQTYLITRNTQLADGYIKRPSTFTGSPFNPKSTTIFFG